MNAAHPLPPEDVMAYVDGETSSAQTRAIEAHLAECRGCRQLEADLREGSRQMREWRVDDAPPSLLAPQVRRPTAYRSVWMNLHGWNSVTRRSLLAASAVVVLAAAAIVVSPARKSPISLAASVEKAESVEFNAALPQAADAVTRLQGGTQGLTRVQDAVSPRVARTATLRMTATDFDRVRPALDRILQRVGGFAGAITASDRPGQPRSIRGLIRIPSAQLDTALTELRGLGRVTEDSQNAEDVTMTVMDLDVRLANARVTEKRLSDVLQNRTGRVGDVLEVEREMARVRTEIEQMEAQRKQLESRVELATITLEIVEERAAAVNLGPVAIPRRLRHAIADGVESAAMSILGAAVFVLRHGPVMLLWTLVLGLPAWWAIRRYVPRPVQRPGGV